MKSSLCTLVAASALSFLTACGGSGDDNTQVLPPGGSVTITSANQTNVARAGVNSGLSVAMAQGALGSGQSAAPDAAGRAHAMASLVRRALDNAGRKSVASLGAHAAAVNTSTDNCAAGGTIASAFDDKDGNQMLSAGDVITTTFSQCRESATNIVNGVVVITISATPIVNATSSQLSVNAQFQALAVVDDGSTYTIDGLVAVAETDNDTSAVSNATLTVGAGGLGVVVASTGYNDSLTFGQGLVITTATAYDGSTGSVSVAGTLTSASLGGPVTIATPVVLTASSSDPYPSAGQMIITGASGSKLVITVLNNAQVKLELDSNGDGTIDSTSTVAWSALVG